MQISVRSQTAAQTTLSWQPVAGAARYRILWSDRPGETVRFKAAGESGESLFTFCRSTHIPYYIKVQALAENGALLEESTPVQTPEGRVLQQQLAALYDQISSRKPYAYAPEQDADYQRYARLYQRQGQAAMEDTMGQAAALSGGYGSS